MNIEQSLLRKQWEAKKKEREAETNPLRKKQLFEEERDLRIQCEIPHPNAGRGGCYTCGHPADIASDLWPFCSKPCHERWSRLNNYQDRTIKGASDLNIRRRQARAMEIAEEKREKRLGGRAIA